MDIISKAPADKRQISGRDEFILAVAICSGQTSCFG